MKILLLIETKVDGELYVFFSSVSSPTFLFVFYFVILSNEYMNSEGQTFSGLQ
jgi:hypothetical protein